MAEHDHEADPQIPDSLRHDLAELYQPKAYVPTEVDDQLLARARRDLAPYRPHRRAWRWALPSAGAAAAAAVVAMVIWLGHQPSHQTEVLLAQTGVMREDIDHDGQVDILDAFALARHIQAGRSLQPQWDLNRDGKINSADVDAIAAKAVALNGSASG